MGNRLTISMMGLLLGCAGKPGSPGSDPPIDLPEDTADTAELPVPSGRVIAALHRDAHGDPITHPDDRCPDGFGTLGWLDGARVCAAKSTLGRGVTLDRDAEGFRAEHMDKPGETCDLLEGHLGGWGRGEVCLDASGRAVAYLDRNRDGVPVDALPSPGNVCPPGAEHLGGRGLDEACALLTGGPIVALTRRADGADLDDLADDGAVCPDSWTHVGGQQFSIACHGAGAGPAIAIDSAPDGRTWSADGEAALCPDGWAHIGGRATLAVCVSENPMEVVWLDDASSCPDSHRWIGSARGRAACAAPVE